MTLPAREVATAAAPATPVRRRPRGRHRGADASGSARRSPSTDSTWSSRAARSTASSGPTAPARRRRSGCCSGWSAHSGTQSLLGHADARGERRACPAAGRCAGRRPGVPPVPVGPGQPRAARRGRPLADPAPRAPRIDAALDRVGLLAAAGKRYRAYSLGMRQRLAIAAALLTPRELLVLDEPTNGLDPQGTREVRHLVASLAEDGATVLISSHLLSEVEQICTHLGIMSDGRLVAQGTVAELRGGRVTTVGVDDVATVGRRVGARSARRHRRRGRRRRGPRPPGTGRARDDRGGARARRRSRARVRGRRRRAWRTCSSA